MKTQRTLFDDSHGDMTASATTSTLLLKKPAIKQRIQNTTLRAGNTFFELIVWKTEDEALTIHWMEANTVVGEVLVGSTKKGVCFLGFINDDPAFASADLQRRFPRNKLKEENNEWLEAAVKHLNNPKLNLPLHLQLKGTDFQLKIWKQLMRIPFGGLTTYGELGNGMQQARPLAPIL